MKTTEVQATFAALLDTFEPISGQPTDEDLTRLRRAALSALVPIPYDRVKGKHSLLGLLLTDVEYKARYGIIFPAEASDRPAIYDENIAADAKAGVRAKAEAIHQAKLEDWKFFDCAQREVRNLIVHCVEDTWIRELRDPITGYAHVPPLDIMDHLWKTCSGLHSIDVLALRTKMLTMHEDAQGIPEYINALEDAQKRSARAGSKMAFTDTDLMLVAMTALYSTEQFPRATEKWEDMDESKKTWGAWKTLYKVAEAKEKVRIQAAGGKDQFGAAHLSGEGHLTPFDSTPPASEADATSGPPEGALEGYFDSLAAAASTDQNVLAELVKSVAELTKTNAQLVQQVTALTKLGQQGERGGRNGRDTRTIQLCKNCKKEVFHKPEDCFELEANKKKRYPGWKTCL